MDNIVFTIFKEEMEGDTSFLNDKPSGLGRLFGGGSSYSNMDMRDTWDKGIQHGIEIGLRRASLEGQKIEFLRTKNPKHQEFLEKFYKLAGEYECAMQYHPIHGMVIIDVSNGDRI